MRPTTISFVTALVFLAVGAALGTWSVLAQGPLPGDLAVTRAIQAALGSEPGWAGVVTETAKAPFVWGLLAAGLAIGWVSGGWRTSGTVAVSFGAGKLLDLALRAVIHTPKPSADLVAVAEQSQSSGFPSTFGLVYGAIFGALLLGAFASVGWRRAVFCPLCLIILCLGGLARLAPGGHWNSQLVASYCLALAIAGLTFGALIAVSPSRSPRDGVSAANHSDRPTGDAAG